jgi:signal transduction histidine kinase
VNRDSRMAGTTIRVQLALACLAPLIVFAALATLVGSLSFSIQAARAWVQGTMLALTVVISSALLLYSVRRVTQPLSRLVAALQQLSAGEPVPALPVEGPREVRMLTSVFNQMVGRLAEQQAALRHYASEVLRGQEDERRRLARELHDQTVQQLVGLVQRIDLCRNDIVRDPASAKRRLDELSTLTKTVVSDVHRMSNDLRPLILEDMGLVVAVQMLGDQLQRRMPSARIHCEIVGKERRLDPEMELTVFRVTQEALSNVGRHADGASRVLTTLYFEPWGILLTVEDNGPGFQVADAPDFMRRGHLGLGGMLERARLFAGELKVDSEPGRGTVVTLRIQSPVATLNRR